MMKDNGAYVSVLHLTEVFRSNDCPKGYGISKVIILPRVS